jgi:RNA polymerase sigma-70 factor (ECF subfamily)
MDRGKAAVLTLDRAPCGSARSCAPRCARLCTPRGFAAAYTAHAAELAGYCHRALGDRGLAEEVTQEVFVKAWRCCARCDTARCDTARCGTAHSDGRGAATGDLGTTRSLRTWLFAIARNAVIDAARRRGRRPPVHPDAERVTHQAEPSDPIARFDTAEQVHGGLARLSADHRAILTAIFIDELTYERAATRLGVPIGTVKSRVHYALRALRAQVDKASAEQPCRHFAE